MLCKDNWIDMSWDGLPARKLKENLKVEIKKQAQSLLPFEKACDLVAEEIYSQHKNLYLGLSGGSDSENIANVLLRNKIPFVPVILEYNHIMDPPRVNENWWAKQWCRKNQITPLIVYSTDYMETTLEKQRFLDIKPRLIGGPPTAGLMLDAVEEREGQLITGYQLEYYPDYDQMTYLEPQLGEYIGFVVEESDLYLETLVSNRHPWGFYYWTPEIMASFVHQWDTNLNMQENKSEIYKTSLRPKIGYPPGYYKKSTQREQVIKNFGTLDCALLGTKEALLKKLVK